jgi:hypothetical protein
MHILWRRNILLNETVHPRRDKLKISLFVTEASAILASLTDFLVLLRSSLLSKCMPISTSHALSHEQRAQTIFKYLAESKWFWQSCLYKTRRNWGEGVSKMCPFSGTTNKKNSRKRNLLPSTDEKESSALWKRLTESWMDAFYIYLEFQMMAEVHEHCDYESKPIFFM